MTVSDTQIQRLADEAAISMLVARIAQLVDVGDLADYAQCFAAEAEWVLPAGSGVGLPAQVRSGVDDIVNGARERREAGIQGPGTRTRHVVSTTVIDVDGDHATGRSYWRYYAATDTTPELRLLGQYDDEFLRTPAGWRLLRRRLTHG